MPNWVANRLIITGEEKSLNRLVKQVSRPYTITSFDPFTLEEREREVDEVFSMWNIIAPTNLDEYHERDKWVARKEEKVFAEITKDLVEPKPTKSIEEVQEDIAEALNKATEAFNSGALDFGEVVAEFDHEVRTKNDWYYWNIRNWGCKWDVSDADRYLDLPYRVIYKFETPWSPPIEAITTLAKDYPDLNFSIKFIDEGDNFAGEVGWSGGNKTVEIDLEITHDLNEELHGYCYACDDENGSDPDYADSRERYGCDEQNIAGLMLDLALGTESEDN
jgi:hypothetical protein